MNTPMNLSGARALAVGAGLALALAMGAAPTAAMAEVRVGTTDVTVKADISNVSFKGRQRSSPLPPKPTESL